MSSATENDDSAVFHALKEKEEDNISQSPTSQTKSVPSDVLMSILSDDSQDTLLPRGTPSPIKRMRRLRPQTAIQADDMDHLADVSVDATPRRDVRRALR
ncbi:hypothetical protein ACI68E_001697 [Malassezia pachydermatis]